MLLGLVCGGLVLVLGFWLVVGVSSLLLPDGGPWVLVVVVAAASLALVVPAIVAALKDLRGRRDQPLVDWLRLAALGVAALLVAGSLSIGGETAEVGIFAAGIGGAAAFTVLGAVIAERRR
jgi:hypothetical protein